MEKKNEVPQENDESSGYISSGDIFKALKKLWKLLPVFFILMSLGIGGAFYITYVPVYSSSATFSVSLDEDSEADTGGYNASTVKQLAKTFPYILSSGILSDIVAEDLGTAILPADITASADETSGLFYLTVTASDPETANTVLLSVIDNYPKIADFVVGDTDLYLIEESGINHTPSNELTAKKVLIYGTLGALVLFASVVFIFALTHKSIMGEDDIKALINIRCYGSVPLIHLLKRGHVISSLLISNPKILSTFAEAFRLIRSRIERDKSINSLLVTSSSKGEGKTTCSVNLAFFFADKGHRVVLLDCDLRNPSVTRVLGISNDPKGISDYLAGNAAIEDIVYSVKNYGSLYIVPAGNPVRNASEVLDSPKMKLLISKLKSSADYIIIDSPPSLVMTDAAILSSYTDASLYVIRQDYAPSGSVVKGAESLAIMSKPIICILNGTEKNIGYYGRYGSSRYGSKYNSYGYERKATEETSPES